MQDAESILRPLKIPDAVKAQAWDAFEASKNEDELAAKIQSLNLPNDAKASLWDLKHSAKSAATPISHGATGSWDAPEPPGILSRIWNAGKLPGPESPLYVPGQMAEEEAQMVKAGVEAVGHVARHPLDNLVIAPLNMAVTALSDHADPAKTVASVKAMAQPVTVPARGAAALVAPGRVNAPTEEENRAAAGGAFVNAAMTMGPGAVEEAAPYVKDAAVATKDAVVNAPKNAADFLRDKLHPAPVESYLRALGGISKDPTARTWMPKLMDELNTAGDVEHTVDTDRAIIADRLKHYNDISDQIVKPQADVKVPGSRAEHIRARIDAIPDKIRLDDPAKYAELVKKANDTIGSGTDYTIGELNKLRQDYERAVKWNKSPTGAMQVDSSLAAMDKASARWAIDKFYDSLDQNSLTGVDVKELKARTGALLKGEEALRPRTNQAAIQSAQSWPAQAMESAGHFMRPGKFLENTGSGVGTMINSDIASAMRRWQRTPSEIVAGAPKLPNPISQVRQPLALPPGSNTFHIDPSAGELYGQPTAADRLRSITRAPAQPGEGIPMRDVTPPKQKLLEAAPLEAKIIQRSGREVEMPDGTITRASYDMPAPVRGLLEKYLRERKSLPPAPAAPARQITAGSALRDRVFNMGGDVEVPIVHQMADHFLSDFAERIETGDSHLTGKLKVQENAGALNAGEELKQRFGGGYKFGTPWDNFPESPGALAKAARAKKGALYERMLKAARETSQDILDEQTAKQDAKFEKDTANWNVD